MCEVRRRLREAWASAGTSRVKGDAHTGLMSAEPVTAVDLPDDGDGQCWCCGTVERPDRMVHLGNHPEVHLCLRCAHFVHQQAWQIEDEVRGGPGAWAREGLRNVRAEVTRRGGTGTGSSAAGCAGWESTCPNNGEQSSRTAGWF